MKSALTAQQSAGGISSLCVSEPKWINNILHFVVCFPGGVFTLSESHQVMHLQSICSHPGCWPALPFTNGCRMPTIERLVTVARFSSLNTQDEKGTWPDVVIVMTRFKALMWRLSGDDHFSNHDFYE